MNRVRHPNQLESPSESWAALWCLRPDMDETDVRRMLREAESDDTPEFRLVAAHGEARRLVEAVRTCMEVERALGSPEIRRVEFEMKGGRVTDTIVEQEVSPSESLDAVASREAFQGINVARHGGKNTRVIARVHRQHR